MSGENSFPTLDTANTSTPNQGVTQKARKRQQRRDAKEVNDTADALTSVLATLKVNPVLPNTSAKGTKVMVLTQGDEALAKSTRSSTGTSGSSKSSTVAKSPTTAPNGNNFPMSSGKVDDVGIPLKSLVTPQPLSKKPLGDAKLKRGEVTSNNAAKIPKPKSPNITAPDVYRWPMIVAKDLPRGKEDGCVRRFSDISNGSVNRFNLLADSREAQDGGMSPETSIDAATLLQKPDEAKMKNAQKKSRRRNVKKSAAGTIHPVRQLAQTEKASTNVSLPTHAPLAALKVPPSSEKSNMKPSNTSRSSKSAASKEPPAQNVPTSVEFPSFPPLAPLKVPTDSEISYTSVPNPSVVSGSSISQAAKTIASRKKAKKSSHVKISEVAASLVTLNPIVDQDLDELMNATKSHRLTFLTGPMITVFIGDKAVRGVYKRAAMVVSSVLNQFFKEDPESLEYHFPALHLDADAVRHLLVHWMNDTCTRFEAIPVTPLPSFRGNLELLRAIRFLGMEQYAKFNLSWHVRWLKSNLPQYEDIVHVAETATSSKDPMFTAMINTLTHWRHKDLIPDPEEFLEFLASHPKIATAMDNADQFFGAERREREANWKAEQEARRLEHQAEKHASWLKRQIEREEKRIHDTQTAESLRIKMNTNRNVSKAVQTVTAAEAAMLRGY
ncbi:uncharacterized protein BDR25DRAFT_309406 [Lindgomyces ingoldianus]|uniref:Uncharacterized protein n=1 Tax=Lindgomyces ingoldianus TaxID=673940 RepID=A0ACB6RD36_9PLEO|nr:uncharacterized protein BDR25DRAFT_309406 [Lindgomyces ingoldianus]KAF2477106.1 hypothetical protein BDR25DRAFT_309406 [Lindgomyces ingoldianus]